MPRLTHRRALTLSLTGSAVSNLVPMGGALGIGLNYWMTRSWGFSRPAFTLYTFVTNLWDVMAKLSLPALALAALLLTGDVTHPQLANIATIAMVILGVLLLLVLTALSSERAACLFGRLLTPPIQLAFRLTRSDRRVDLSQTVLELRQESIGLLRTGWMQLSLGMIAYSALQALLLWSCLHMLGTTLTAPEIFAGYALERVLTLAMITPGGTGFVEVGITALLIAVRRRSGHHGRRGADLPRVHVRPRDPGRRSGIGGLALATARSGASRPGVDRCRPSDAHRARHRLLPTASRRHRDAGARPRDPAARRRTRDDRHHADARRGGVRSGRPGPGLGRAGRHGGLSAGDPSLRRRVLGLRRAHQRQLRHGPRPCVTHLAVRHARRPHGGTRGYPDGRHGPLVVVPHRSGARHRVGHDRRTQVVAGHLVRGERDGRRAGQQDPGRRCGRHPPERDRPGSLAHRAGPARPQAR